MRFAMPILTFLVIAAACARTPVTDRRTINFVPDSEMNAMGTEAYQEVLTKESISHDRTLTAVIVNLGKRIAKASGESFDWEFNLIDSPQTVNAFCLPGGKVAVYTGILSMAKTEAGLAAVLGHEVAHAVARHGAERLSEALIVEGALMAASEAMKDSRYKGSVMAALGLGAEFGVMMPYSRVHESEADRIGFIYMAKAGYDPREAIALWDRMAANTQRPPEFLSTHPDPTTRARDLEKQLSDVMPLYEQSEKQSPRDLSSASTSTSLPW
jgi:metalloendopeptidase OMA1, mitochondrial